VGTLPVAKVSLPPPFTVAIRERKVPG